VDASSVVDIDDVLDGMATVGRRVVVLDDLGDLRGLGTALALAEAGHDTTLVTSAAVAGAGLYHSAADVPLRRRYATAGGTVRASTVMTAWTSEGATVRSTLDGAVELLPADTLVLAETAVAETSLADALRERGVAFQAIGDCVAPRRASLAVYEARDLARTL
jgi:hypothetical protein